MDRTRRVGAHRGGRRRPEPDMTVARSVADVLSEHVTLELECIERMYLNLYVPKLQYEAGARWYLRTQRAQRVPTSAGMGPLTEAFVAGVEAYIAAHQLPVRRFQSGERNDDVVKP